MVVELASGFAVVGAGAWLFGRAQPAAVRGTLRSRGLKGFVCPDRGALSRGELAETTDPRAKSAKDVSHAENAESAETMRSSDLESPLRGLETSGEAAPENTGDGALRSLRSLRDNQQPGDGALHSLRSLRDNQQPGDGALRSLRSLRDFEKAGAGETSRGDEEPEHGPRAWCSSSACPFLTRIDCGAPVSAVSDKVLVAPAAARTGARLVKVVPMSLARSLRTTEFSSEWVVMATRSRTTRISLADGESLGVRPEAAVAWTGARPTGFCPRLRLLDVLLPRGPRDLLLHFHGPAIVWVEGSENLPLRRGAPGKAVF